MVHSINFKKSLKKWLIRLGIFLVFIYFFFPLFWMVWTSVKPRKFSYHPGIWRFKPTLQGYVDVLTEHRIPSLALNSFVISVAATIIALVIGTLAAYALVRFNTKHRRKTTLFFLIVRFIPPISLIIPMFLLGKFTGILDTRLILVLVYQILCITFTVLMMKGFLKNIPASFEEAAMLEGCSRLKAFFLVTIPLIKNGLFATGIFLFLYTWKEFQYALFLTSYKARTLPTAVQYFLGTQGVEWNAAMAYGFMSIVPVLVVAVIFRDYMIQGLTFGLSK
ncbi:MAG: carbohydrate ABC transporter permease [Halanaerobiales bacterium]